MTDKIPMKDPYIIVKWHASDIKSVAPFFTDEECLGVLAYLRDTHNPEVGINWEVIDLAIEHLRCEHQGMTELKKEQNAQTKVPEQF